MDDRAAWDRYWSYDRVATCMSAAGRGNYSETVARPWQEFFRALPLGSTILDVCTGNGAIALLASEVSRDEGRAFAITGVDLAAIDPLTHVACAEREDLLAVEFVGRMPAEKLAFPDNAFMAVVSQYGIEYAKLDEALPAAVRVLAPGGELRFGIHAAEGSIAEQTRAALSDADFLLTEIDLPGAAVRCFTAVREAEETGANSEQARKSVAAFEAALCRAADRLPTATDREMLQNAGAVLLDAHCKRAAVPLPDLIAKAEEIRTEILVHVSRQQQLLTAARSTAEMDAMVEQLQRLGCRDVGWSPQAKEDGALIGYVLRARKNM